VHEVGGQVRPGGVTAAAGDPDLADRIEFAMKFLKMSCDDSASSGF